MADVTARERFLGLLSRNAAGAEPAVAPSPTVARRLLARTTQVPFFAHSYPFILNMEHGSFGPDDVAEFAHANELAGLCLHIGDGDARSVRRMDGAGLERFRQHLDDLGLTLHLEISSTEPAEVDEAVRLASALGVENIRLYARHQGPLSAVTERIHADLCHAAERANARGLHFDYEQHEDLRADEIAALLTRVGDSRLNVLFDYANSWNAHEEPLAALRVLAPWIRQVHVKGARRTVEGKGWGQLGVPQGSPEDELPAALLLYELLLLGEERPQVIAFALENEVGYHAPPLRHADEAADPHIAWRAPSQTPLAPGEPPARRLAGERRWAQQQVTFNRLLVSELRALAAGIATDPPTPAPPFQEKTDAL
jgi:sugar phosphate isomerase/epimerase